MSLYTIDKELLDLVDKHTDKETGEINPEFYQEIEGMINTKWWKLNNIARYMISLDSQSKELDIEAKRLKERSVMLSNRSERMREIVKQSMMMSWQDKYETDIATFSLRKTSRVHIYDEEQIPDEYMRIKTTREPEKKKIKEAIEAWEQISWATIVEDKSIIVK